MAKLDLRLAAILGLPGGIIALLTLTGWFGSAIEFTLWTLLAIALWIPVATRRAAERPLVTLTIAGIVAGIVTGIVQAAFATTLIANNATYAATYPEADPATRGLLFAFAFVIGLTWGALFGLVSWGLVAWRAKKQPIAA